jgi:putative ABC transport system ATP-binding protein
VIGTRSAPTKILVECNAVGHTYGSGSLAVVAVAQATCRIPHDARVAITGASGSGKSTLLHLLAGLETPTSGLIRWPGLKGPPAGNPDEVGVIFQGPSLIPYLDVIGNVGLPLILNGTPDAAAAERAMKALSDLDLADLGSKLPDELSGGQGQRVAIARVLAARPTLILADEPTGQLDGITARHVIDVLLQAADRLGAALVISTHDEQVAARLEQRWDMHDGHLAVPHRQTDGHPS